MFGIGGLLGSIYQSQMNAMARMLPPTPVSVITDDLIHQGEREIERLMFWTAFLPDWLEPAFILKMVRKLDAITDQLEHFAGLNR
jgi:hypothetical protein